MAPCFALGEERVKDVANYVMSFSKPAGQYDEERAARGNATFHGSPANCFTCHGDKGQVRVGLVSNLTDDVWLWVAHKKPLSKPLPTKNAAWDNFLDKDKLHIMTAFAFGACRTKAAKQQLAAAAPAPAASAEASAPAAASAASAGQ